MKEKAIGKVMGGLLICLMLGLVFGGVIDTTSATTEKTTVSVTESSPWFTKGTNSGSGPWYSHTYDGHDYISTYVGGMSGNPSQPDCWAKFKPYLSQSGKYEVYAYFYACKDTSSKVPFTVKYDGGSTTIKVSQYRSSPAWKEKYLGTWNFAAGSSTYVKVTDATGETYNGITGLSVGTIKFVKVQTTTVPSPPTLISPGSSSEPGQEIDTLTLTFNWNSVSNADYYGLYVSKYPYGSGNIVFEKEGIYGTSFTIPSGKLQDGVKYRWNMRAHNSAGWSGFSSKLYFTVNIPQPPSPPTLISPGSSSEPGQEIDTLTPTFNWNSVSNADYYGLYVSKYPYGSSNIVFEKEGIYGTSTIPSGKLQDGVKYRWNMRAHNSAGWSGFSSKLYFTVNIPQPPSPPTLISPGSSSEPGQEINTLTPTFNWNSVSNADYYGLYVSKYPYGSSNIVFEKEGIYGTSFTIPSGKLQDGVKYRWNMRAHNSAGWSDISNTLYFQTPGQKPDPPTLLSPGTSSAPGEEVDTLTPTFRWSSVSGADYYALAISEYPYGPSHVIHNPQQLYGTSYTVPDGVLEHGKKYRWQMQAHNSAGWSDISNTLYFQTPGQKPDPPTLLSPGTSSAPGEEVDTLTPTFRWNSVSGADYYALAISEYPYGPSHVIHNPQHLYGTSYTVPGGVLEHGKKYRWQMQAHNSAGWSDISNTLYFQTSESPPSAPIATSPGTSSAPGPVIDSLTPTLQWNAVSGAGYYALAIREDPPNGPIVYNPQQVYGTSHSVPSGKLKHGHEYRWNMQAHGSGGWSPVSNTLYFQTPEAAPDAPTITSPGSNSAPGPVIDDLTPTLQWDAVSGADYYALAIREDPPNGPIVYNPQQVYGTSHSVPSGKLKHGHEYRWNMQAHGSGGWSSVSNTRYFQTSESPPSAPTTTSPGTSSAPGPVIDSLTPTLQWNAVSGAGYYALAIREDPPNGPIVYNPQQVYGTSHSVPSGKLKHGHEYRWNMQAHGSGGWSSVSNTRYFQTSESPPSAPTTTSPGTSSAPGPVIDSLTPTLQWNAVSGAGYYALAIREDPPNGPIVYNPQQVYGTSHSVPSGKLKHGHEYRWNMQAHGSGGWSSVSNTRYFQTSEAPPNYANPPTHVSPSNGKTEVSLRPTFKWNSVSGADYYGLYISEPPYGESNLVYNGIVYGTSFNLPADKKLQHGVKYHWNMASHNSAGWSYERTDGGKKYSDSWYFTTKSAQPTGSIIVTTNLDIAFFTITGPETYQAIGKSWSISNAPAGLYTITYTEIPGYSIPSSDTKTLTVGGSITFSGSYTKIGLYQLPATRGKISWFSSEESGNPGAWREWLGENLGTDEATKYWYCAMRWPYYDPNTGFFDQAAKDWWQNKKILLTNPKNDKQVVLVAKDWGPTWWTGRVIDVSKTAFDILGVETEDIVNIEFADQNAPLGPSERVKLNKGDWVEVILNLGLRVRDVPGIGSNDYWVAPKGSLGVIIGGPERKDGYTWWKIMYDHSPSVFEGREDKKDTWPTIIGWSAEGGTDGDYFKKSSIPASLPKFLTLPFKDADIKIPQGWVYSWTSDPNAHNGIDYIKGSIDSSSSWQSFDVVAAADGWAMWSEQQGSTGVYGKFVVIRHDKKDYVGNDFFTLYAHLESVTSGIPYQNMNNIDYNYNDPSKWKSVKRGEIIGRAGNTGASNTGIHLHFEVQRKAYAHYKTDPYDLYKIRSFYPGGGSYSSSGSRYLWTTDPPSLPSLHPDIGYAVLVAGQGDLKFWKPWEYGTQWITNRNVNRAYQVLRSLGFDDERILYLNNDLLQDADGDGDADVDWAPSNNGFKLAMGWARLRVGEHSPFILYLTGHGERGEFYLGSGMSDSLFVSNLNQELDKFPEKTKMLIIVDSCYSGSFITAPETISAPNRVIVTSSHDDQKVPAFSNYLFWSPEFWQCVQQGMDTRQAFIKGTKAANDALTRALLVGLISPQPADFCQPWLDDNGDSVGHPPESLGDDGNLAATMKIGVPGGPPSVGEDASNPQLFKDCYDKNGGASKLGYPVGKVHRWKKGYIQDFRGGDGYEGAIMQPDDVNCAYAVYGSIWSKYLILEGAKGVLGYPLTDELSGHVSSITGAKCRYNKFYGGAIVHHATRPKAGLTVFLGHGIFNKWEELNYGESALGLPTSDEREAPQSGADSFDTTGVVCDFEGGHLYWHRVGKYKDKAFETHGAIDSVYQQEGGPGNWLGFPISDEDIDSKTGYARSDFEGGYITTPNGIDYHAYPYTPTPSPSPTTSPTPTLTPPNVHDIAVEHSKIPVLNWPLKGEIEDRQILLGFGDIWTWTYCGGLPKKHTGVDLKASDGEDVFAAYDGVVKAVYALSSKHNWGKGVVIEHSGFTTTYMHVNPIVNVGAHVNKGQKISTIIIIDGDEHLHFGVRSGTYSDISKRGALPQKHGDSDHQDGRFTGCKSDPLFPEKFVDPMKLKYEIKREPKQTGLIIVSANLDQATFTIKGPKTYQGSGNSWRVSNAPTGTYKIIYEAVVKKENGKAVGYDVLKKSEEKTLIASGSVRFDVEYIKNTPPTRGKISCFCPSCCPTSAWEEPLGESCGKDDAAKYWFVAMRWPYAKWDYKIEDTVSTGLSEGSDWKNKKILVTNPKNGRQVVLEAKDWGPAPWTGRVIDVSPTALSALGAETDEEVNIELADKNADLGPPPSTKFKTGDLIVTKKKWNLRSDRKIAEECIKTTLDKVSEGEVLENDDNGKFVPDNKYYWWYVKFGDYEGWCAEDGLKKSETFNEYDHDRDGIVRGDEDDLRMQYQAYHGFLSGEEYDHDKDGIIRGDADDLRMQYYKYQGF